MPVDLDPENDMAWEIFAVLMTQIRTGGLGGFMGVDYAAVLPLLIAKDVPRQDWDFVLDSLTKLNSIALSCLGQSG